jgi:two-component system, OmpR family, sensor histidine kinase ResE
MAYRLTRRLLMWWMVAVLAISTVHLGADMLNLGLATHLFAEGVLVVSLLMFPYYFLRRRVIGPLASIRETARKITGGDLTARSDVKSPEEFHDLSETINTMVGQLVSTYAQLKDSNIILEKTVQERTSDLSIERDKLSAIFRSIPIGIIYLSKEGGIIDANPLMEEIIGLPSGRLKGKDAAMLPASAIREALTTDGPHADINQGGRHYAVSSNGVFDGSGNLTGLLKVFADITEEKDLERKKTDFASMVTHDLKSPLTSILGYSDLLLAEHTTLNEDGQAFIKSIRSNGARLLGIVEEYLDFAKVEAGVVSLSPAWVKPSSIVFEAAAELVFQAAEKHIKIVEEIPEGLDEFKVDREKMVRVLTNLISNAVKYSPEGGKVVISGRSLQEGGQPCIEISVADTGYGISEHDIPHIFERYYRTTQTSGIRGTGLGLSVVKSLVEAHGGSVSVTSKLGAGSTFTIRVPISSQKEKSASYEL